MYNLPLQIVRQFSDGWQPTFQKAAGGAVAVATVPALLFVQDRNNPHLYGLRSYATYPSLLKWPFVSTPPAVWQEDFDQITETETRFIQDNTKPDEQVLVIAFRDWAYLAQAHRAPEASFMPLLVSFDAQFVDRS